MTEYLPLHRLEASAEDKKVYDALLGRLLYSRSGEDLFTGYMLLEAKFSGIHAQLDEKEGAYAMVLWVKKGDSLGWDMRLLLSSALMEFSKGEITEVLRHECGHIALLHAARYPEDIAPMGEVTGKLWNAACDAIVNTTMGITERLKRMGSTLPAITMADINKLLKELGSNYVYVSEKDSEVRIFTLMIEGLRKQVKKNAPKSVKKELLKMLGDSSDEKNDQDDEQHDADYASKGSDEADTSDSGKNFVEDLMAELLGKLKFKFVPGVTDEKGQPISLTKSNLEALEGQIINIVDSVAQAAGNCPGTVREYIDKLKEPPIIKWEHLVRRGVQAAIKTRRETRPTKLNQKLGFGYGKAKATGPRALFMLDTSGSMETRVLSVAINELQRLYKTAEAYLAQYDHGLQSFERITQTFISKPGIVGRGGTSVSTAIHDLEKKMDITRFDAVFIFSDFGDHLTIEESPFGRATVHWFKTDTGYMTPEWGIIVDISVQIKELLNKKRSA